MAPKRKRKDKENETYEYIAKKMKKLEKKLKRIRKDSCSYSDSDNNISAESMLEQNPTQIDYLLGAPDTADVQHLEQSQIQVTEQPIELDEPQPGPSGTSGTVTMEQSTDLLPSQALQSEQPTQTDCLILELLGEDPSEAKSLGKEIHTDLAVRLQHLVTQGITQKERKELLDKYLPPSNCTLIDAPGLNPEMRAAVSEAILKRDKGIELKQKQLSSAMACISEVITTLLQEENKNTIIVKQLMDACRLLGDSQHTDSLTRRSFILFNLKKEMKDELLRTKIDTLLFSKELTETLKTAKFINKSGAELKSSLAPRMPILKDKLLTNNPQRNLNWKAPPPSRKQKGTQRRRELAPKGQHASSSRSSYRAPQPPPPPPPPPAYHRNRR